MFPPSGLGEFSCSDIHCKGVDRPSLISRPQYSTTGIKRQGVDSPRHFATATLENIHMDISQESQKSFIHLCKLEICWVE